MDIIATFVNKFVEMVWSFPPMLKVFLLRMGMVLPVSYFFVRRSFEKTVGIKALQITVAVIVSYLVFRIPTSFFVYFIDKMSPGVYGFFFLLSLLCMIFMPKAIAFYIVPRLGNQIILARVMYAAVFFLLVLQIIQVSMAR